jgi:hypothetical protein
MALAEVFLITRAQLRLTPVLRSTDNLSRPKGPEGPYLLRQVGHSCVVSMRSISDVELEAKC